MHALERVAWAAAQGVQLSRQGLHRSGTVGRLGDFGMSQHLSSDGTLQDQSDSLTITWCAAFAACAQWACLRRRASAAASLISAHWQGKPSRAKPSATWHVRRAAPEQRLGGAVSEKADIHAFGVHPCRAVRGDAEVCMPALGSSCSPGRAARGAQQSGRTCL